MHFRSPRSSVQRLACLVAAVAACGTAAPAAVARPRWTAPFRVAPEAAGPVTVDGRGTVSYPYSRSNKAAVRIRSASDRLGPEQRLATFVDRLEIAAAVANDRGDSLIVWTEQDTFAGIVKQGLRAALRTRGAARYGTSARLRGYEKTPDLEIRTVAAGISSGGAATVLWHDGASWARTAAPSGAFGPLTAVVGPSQIQAAAAGPRGHVAVVTGPDPSGPLDLRLAAPGAPFTAAGPMPGVAPAAPGQIGERILLSLAVGPAGQVAACWRSGGGYADAADFDYIDLELWCSVRSPGGTWSAPSRLSDHATDAAPVAAFGPDGRLHVAWLDGAAVNGGPPIFVRSATKTASGGFGAVQTLEHARVYRPAIAVDARGTVFLAWDAYRGTTPDGPRVAVRDPGHRFSAIRRLQPHPGHATYGLHVAAAGRSTAAVVWDGEDRSNIPQHWSVVRTDRR